MSIMESNVGYHEVINRKSQYLWSASGLDSGSLSAPGCEPQDGERDAELRTGVLETQVRMAVVAAGLDPTIGYFHGRYDGKQTLALDLMEPKRPQVDRAVLEFAKAHTFSAGDVALLDGAVCRLNPQVARNIDALVSKQLEASGAAGALLSFII
jgi:hypothetical protein